MSSRRDEALQRAIGGQVRALRQRAGLTLEQVAVRIEAPISVVSRIEAGDRGVSVPTLFALARALRARPGDLVTFEGGEEPAREGPRAPDEEALLAAWRVAPGGVREALLTLLMAAVKG